MRKRLSGIIITSVLIAGMVTLCIVRWDAWFANPAEATYFVPDAPNNITLGFGESVKTRSVSWRSAHAEPSFLAVDGDTIAATCRQITSRSGEAAYYRAETKELSEGRHTYFVQSGDKRSEEYSFTIAPDSAVHFIIFGDIQEKDTVSPFASFCEAASRDSSRSLPDFIAYTGDVIDRPTDFAWQTWFSALHGLQTGVPQIAAAGNHEYLKGVFQELDPRWTAIFATPGNGPERFSGTTCCIDYPSFRLIILNTQALRGISDHTIAQSWLNRMLQEAGGRFTIVVMHHSIFAGTIQRYHPLTYLSFRTTLRKADVVIAGHDHLYSRRAAVRYDILSDPTTIVSDDTLITETPVFIITGSSSKQYLPKCSPKDQRIGSNTQFYEDIVVTDDTLHLITRLLGTGDVYDDIVIDRATRTVVTPDSLPEEILDVPERYNGKNNAPIRRFYNRREERLKKPSVE